MYAVAKAMEPASQELATSPKPSLRIHREPEWRQVKGIVIATLQVNPADLFESLAALEHSKHPHFVALDLKTNEIPDAPQWLDDFQTLVTKQYMRNPAYPFTPLTMIIVPQGQPKKVVLKTNEWANHPDVCWLELQPNETPEQGALRYWEGLVKFAHEYFVDTSVEESSWDNW